MLSAFLMFILRPFQRADALNLKGFSPSFRLVFGTFNILVLLLLQVFLPWSTSLIIPYRYSWQEPCSILYTWIPSKYFIWRSMGSLSSLWNRDTLDTSLYSYTSYMALWTPSRAIHFCNFPIQVTHNLWLVVWVHCRNGDKSWLKCYYSTLCYKLINICWYTKKVYSL